MWAEGRRRTVTIPQLGLDLRLRKRERRSLGTRVLSLNDRRRLTGCLANTICPTRGASLGSASSNTAAALKESTEFPEERKELNEEHTTLVTCVSIAAHLPL